MARAVTIRESVHALGQHLEHLDFAETQPAGLLPACCTLTYQAAKVASLCVLHHDCQRAIARSME